MGLREDQPQFPRSCFHPEVLGGFFFFCFFFRLFCFFTLSSRLESGKMYSVKAYSEEVSSVLFFLPWVRGRATPKTLTPFWETICGCLTFRKGIANGLSVE